MNQEIVTSAFAALSGIPNCESPLDTGLQARFTHRVIVYAIRAALREGSHFEETLTASILWSYPDFRFSYQDVSFVLQHLLQCGEVVYQSGEYRLRSESNPQQGDNAIDKN